MTYEQQLQQLVTNKPTRCECGGKLEMVRQGSYQCEECGKITYDDFGKIKKYLDEKGPSPALEIAQATGVPVTRITELIREGRIETTGTSK